MSDIDFERVRAVFLAARDLDAAAQARVLDEQCATDAALRAEVEELLVHHVTEQTRATPPIVEDAIAEFLAMPTGRTEPLPRSFGAFELLEIIGRGGMGTVYRARQRTPDRLVALKVIQPGMISPAMLARFRFEADVLARLRHPGIAQIYEAGAVSASDDGGPEQPYFALELIAGHAIDLYAVEHDLDVRARIALLVKVCDAVHHAHQKGVIHRDLKPGNILVDSDGQPKVLDFGVARATDADVRATTLQTNVGQLVGTLPYMSPEQVSGDPHRLDIRSDVYALGVLLFELLTGRLPYDLRDRALADAALMIRDVEAPRLGAIDTKLRGDLETIVAKTLEKDPSRRYTSGAALAEDLRRFLARQPIVARPPSMRYQLGLFARRHRTLVTGGAVGLVLLALATGITIGFGLRAARSTGQAAAQQEIADRTSSYLDELLTLADPHNPSGGPAGAEILEATITRLDAQDEVPEVEARVRTALGRTFLQRRQTDRAYPQIVRAVELWRTVDPEGPELAGALAILGTVSYQARRDDLGETALREAISIFDAHGHPDATRARAYLLETLLRGRRGAEAESLARTLLASARATDNHELVVGMLRALATIATMNGDHAAAERHLMEGLELSAREFPERHPMQCSVLIDLSRGRLARGDVEGAADAARRAYDHAHRVWEPGSHEWMTTLNVHGQMLIRRKRSDELEVVLNRAWSSLIATRGPDDRLTREVRNSLANYYDAHGDPDGAQSVRDGTVTPPGE